MSGRGAQVLDEALALSPRERAEMADRLLSSLDFPSRRKVDALWAKEAEERIDAFERGTIASIPARVVFRNGRKRKS